MSGFDYAKSAATALRLIQRFGAAAQVVAKATAYDPATGTNTGTESSADCSACVIDAEKSSIDGTLVLAGHRVALVAAVGLAEPKVGAKLMWQGAPLVISVVKTLAPSGVLVLYELQVKQ